MTKRLILTESLHLKEEDFFAYVSLPTRGISSERTRCSFVPEHMVLRLHPHSTCASNTAERLSPLAPALRNRYSTAWSLRWVWVCMSVCVWLCLCMCIFLCDRERKWKTNSVSRAYLHSGAALRWAVCAHRHHWRTWNSCVELRNSFSSKVLSTWRVEMK